MEEASIVNEATGMRRTAKQKNEAAVQMNRFIAKKAYRIKALIEFGIAEGDFDMPQTWKTSWEEMVKKVMLRKENITEFFIWATKVLLQALFIIKNGTSDAVPTNRTSRILIKSIGSDKITAAQMVKEHQLELEAFRTQLKPYITNPAISAQSIWWFIQAVVVQRALKERQLQQKITYTSFQLHHLWQALRGDVDSFGGMHHNYVSELFSYLGATSKAIDPKTLAFKEGRGPAANRKKERDSRNSNANANSNGNGNGNGKGRNNNRRNNNNNASYGGANGNGNGALQLQPMHMAYPVNMPNGGGMMVGMPHMPWAPVNMERQSMINGNRKRMQPQGGFNANQQQRKRAKDNERDFGGAANGNRNGGNNQGNFKSKKFCSGFESGNCTYNPCRFRHCCRNCGKDGHRAADCNATV